MILLSKVELRQRFEKWTNPPFCCKIKQSSGGLDSVRGDSHTRKWLYHFQAAARFLHTMKSKELKKLTDKQIIRMAEKLDRQARRIQLKARALRFFIVDRIPA